MVSGKTFGGFFREQRTALKLSLREFCRLNGFDPGNISRLETGKVPPPVSQGVLEAYAKSLKLEPRSRNWDRFFDLAAAETGRIPSHLQKDENATKKLSMAFERFKGQRHHNWTRSVDLESWADRLQARELLPQLVRRLINATSSSIIQISFPSGEGVQRPGFDGILQTTSGNAFVPEGWSGWELGVSNNPGKKAEDDFNKRSKKTKEINPAQMTYVFLTPRKWTTKDEWCKEKKNLKIWTDIRVYDSADLEEWLELAPAVDIWFAGQLGRRPQGVTDLDEHWNALAGLTSPNLRPEVFLVSRLEGVRKLGDWLKGNPSAMEVIAGSGAEAIDFFAAFLANQNEDEKDRLASRAIIIDNKEAWQSLSASKNSLILIPHPSFSIDSETVSVAVWRGHHVFLGSDGIASGREPNYRLERVNRYELEKVLISSGISREQAGKYARESGGSLTVLKRLVTHYPTTDHPTWSQHPNSGRLLPMLLAGQWDEAVEGDKKKLALLAGQPYEQVVETAGSWLNQRDTPLVYALSSWRLVSRQDSWFLLAPSLTSQYLDRLEKVVLEVLTENDPKYDLPPDKRWSAKIQGHSLSHSDRLRTGLAETLAILESMSDRVPGSAKASGRAERLVNQLLGGADWKRWASLADQLPPLAEAAPEVFLQNVERTLRGNRSVLERLFEKSSSLSRSPHTGLLWALECLTWNGSLLPRVSLILADLAKMDKPGELQPNTPSNSLREIYLAWLPHTSASVEKRIEILDSLKNKYPSVWWHLLLNILPSPMTSFSMPTYRPRWRNWAVGGVEQINVGEYWRQGETLANRLLENAGTDVSRWKDLLKICDRFSVPLQLKFIETLQKLNPSSLTEQERKDLAQTIRTKEPYVKDLPGLKVLPRIREQIELDDSIEKIVWLFGHHWDVKYLLERVGNEQGSSNLVETVRQEALNEILESEGLEGVFKLAQLAKSPEDVGMTLGALKSGNYDKQILPTLLLSESPNLAEFAKGYVHKRLMQESWDWVQTLSIQDWSTKELGELSLILPPERKTWDFVHKGGKILKKYYWSNVRDTWVIGDRTLDVEFAVAELLKVGRPFQAVAILAMGIYHKIPVSNHLIMKSLEETLNARFDEEKHKRIQHDIPHLILRLQADVAGNNDPSFEEKLARLEWQYLFLLDGHPVSPKTLYRRLQRDADFFVNLISLVYRSKNESEEADRDLLAEDKSRAKNAYRLLNSWTLLPGMNEEDQINPEELSRWIKQARLQAEEKGYLEVCDNRIGELLAHAPSEKDGSWPCVPVRDAIEEVGTDQIVRGFAIGISNKRGITSKSATEGGTQERALAEQYRKYAQFCELEWPTTATALRQVARQYEKDAEEEDASVRLEGW